MGQKVNPHGLRVGVIKDWDSRWFTSKREFGDTLVEDYKIRKVLKKQLYNAGVPKIEIERTIDNATSKPRIRVTIHCAKPGMVIGRQGAPAEGKYKVSGCHRGFILVGPAGVLAKIKGKGGVVSVMLPPLRDPWLGFPVRADAGQALKQAHDYDLGRLVVGDLRIQRAWLAL